jgi:hypothetical protein
VVNQEDADTMDPTWLDARRRLHVIEDRIARLTVDAAAVSAQRDTRPEEMAVVEHVLAVFEVLRTGYMGVLDALDRDYPELARERLELVGALQARLAQWMGLL